MSGNAAAPPEAPAATPPAPIANEKGELRENWIESLDEDLRGESFLGEVKDIQSMARSVVNARKMVGKDKIVVPRTDEEWGEFYKVGGRPDTAADYNLVRPEDFPEEHYNNELASAAMELFHKIGLSKKQADALFEFNNTNALAVIKAAADADEAAFKETEDALYKEWGNAYEERKHLGNVAIEKAVKDDEEFKARLTDKFGNDPDFIRFASNIGGLFAEHGDVAVPGVPTPSDIQAQIDEAMQHPAYKADYAAHGITKKEHQRQVQKVARLFQAQAKARKTG